MRKLIAIACLLSLLLTACSRDGQAIVVRSKVNGDWRIDSTVRIDNGIVHFECLHSASGRCHYSLLSGCAQIAGSASCNAKLLQHFSIAVDTQRSIKDPSDFTLCVSHLADPMQSDCTPAIVRAQAGS